MTALLLVTLLTACSREVRVVEADVPATPPSGPNDRRIDRYQQNAFQISQGGRYYAWYGCAPCHVGNAGGTDFSRGVWRHGDGFDAVYGYIAQKHPGVLPGYGQRIPAEQLWQITAYVRDLATLDPDMRRRQDLDQIAEPQGRRPPAPLR